MLRPACVMALAILTACGAHHAASDAGDGSGAACTQDDQCGGSARCCAGACVETADCSFAVTSVQPATGYVNGGAYLQLSGAGFSSGMKVMIGDARAPVLVLGPTSAR